MAAKSPTAQDALKMIDLGVYRVTIPALTGAWNPREQLNQIIAALPLFRRLAADIYALEPFLSILYLVSQLWEGLESALLLYLSSRLLKVVRINHL